MRTMCVVWASVKYIQFVQITSGSRVQHCSLLLERVLGVSPLPPRYSTTSGRPLTTKGMRIIKSSKIRTCILQLVTMLCLFIAGISISCVVHASLSVPDWEDRSRPCCSPVNLLPCPTMICINSLRSCFHTNIYPFENDLLLR